MFQSEDSRTNKAMTENKLRTPEHHSSVPRQASTPSTIPRPLFGQEPQTYSTKKERRAFDFKPPPRPPAKSCPPKSRVFRHTDLLRTQAVTFLDSPDGTITGTPLHSSVYDNNKKQSYFQQAFLIESEIGEGCFGTVYRVRSKEDGKVYAVKIARDKYKGPSDRKRKLDEVRKHQFLPKHSNCVRFYQSWEENARLYLQFELCQENLSEFSERTENILEPVIWGYLVDLLLAIRHLHDHDLVHNDIKPENIFIGMDGICKLGDFGLVIDLANPSEDRMEGDNKYLAPEIMQGRFTKACDVFSVGTTILELACDVDLPKSGQLWHDLRYSGPDPSLTLSISAELRRVVQLMMTADPDRRPNVKQVLDLPSVAAAVRRRERQLTLWWSLALVKSAVVPVAVVLLAAGLYLVNPARWAWQAVVKWAYPAPLPDYTPQTAQLTWAADTFSDDDVANCTVSSGGSELAVPIQESSNSSLEHESSPASPLCRPSPLKRPCQTSPGPRYRSRHMARTPGAARANMTASPQKRLIFNSLVSSPNLDNSIHAHSSFQDDDEDDDLVVPDIKPQCLASTFDCFSDDDP